MRDFPARRKIAVLSDMLELGSFEKDGHRLVGGAAARSGFNILVAVGKKARIISEEASNQSNESLQIFHFPSVEEVIPFLQTEISPRRGDIILVKGSCGMRLEKASEALLANKEKAFEFLVRQERRWKN